MKIGEFAKICQTRISVLRHYDKQDLLKPTYIDKFTGYRYYSQEQIAIFFRITALKEAGFSLNEIRELLGQMQDDSDILNLFEKKKALLLETLANLDRAKEFIIGGLNKMDVTFEKKAHELWANYTYETTENMSEAREQLENYLAANNYQRTSAMENDAKQKQLTCRVMKLNSTVAELMESIDFPFENDETAIGKWEIIGEYAVKEDFFEEIDNAHPGYNTNSQIIYFLPQGRRYWLYGWTKGKLLIKTGDASSVNEYEIEEHRGERFMFVSFKSYEYRKGGAPRILVLKQIDNKEYSAEQLAKKDNIDMPFVNDPDVLGKWKAFDYLHTKEAFSPTGSRRHSFFFKELEFFENGSCTSLYGDKKISGNDKQVWTKGYVLRKWDSTACAYEIRTIEAKDYLIIEWKSGDYIWGGHSPNYYVFVRA